MSELNYCASYYSCRREQLIVARVIMVVSLVIDIMCGV